MRSYGVPADQDVVFVEQKRKYDGIVYKRRTELRADEVAAGIGAGIAPAHDGQIAHEIDWFMHSYRPAPKVFIAYDRTAFAGRDDPELRITFDTNLRWRDTALDLRAGDYGDPILPTDQILMEIKIPAAAPVWLAHLLSRVGAFPTSFSKYGACYQRKLLPALTRKETDAYA